MSANWVVFSVSDCVGGFFVCYAFVVYVCLFFVFWVFVCRGGVCDCCCVRACFLVCVCLCVFYVNV